MSLPNPVPKADVSQTHPRDWSYVSEGGATIVFSYTGPPSKEFSGTVLRLRKITAEPPPKQIYKPLDIAEGIDQASSEEDEGYDTSSSEDEDEPDDPTIAFQSRITSKLIPPEHLPRLEPAKLKRHFLEKLAKRGDKKRPESRKDVDRIDTHKKKGVIATDLIGATGWAVEIKPKWAFLPNPAHLSDKTKGTKASYCRFCMHTHQRFIKSPSKFKSEYCPLDLFSGDRERVRKALRDLWNSWVGSNGTINNLKIFVHGSNIPPNDLPHLHMLYDDLKLPDEGRPTSGSGLLEAILPAFTDALLPVLLDTPVLATLAKLQRTLDPLDIEGLSKLWKTDPNTQTPSSAAVGVGSREVKLAEWETFLDEYFTEMKKPKEDLEREWANPTHARLRYYLLAYLMSATFKDCSVILRFAPGEGPTITAIDLDPKSVDRLAKWEKLDNEIVECFTESGDKAKPACVDARVE
ncbi:Inositol-pentakisphosphate 2-kinase [Tulasnella sp. UAMH 9824]|nr:Inositol-pentakisphosphate 2-kinase [Tulasnella sp. UAMH 9824]